MTPGEEIDNQLDVLETKIELLMSYLGLEFEFDSWSDEPTGIREAKKEEKPRPVIANGTEYDSYADYLESREGGE